GRIETSTPDESIRSSDAMDMRVTSKPGEAADNIGETRPRPPRHKLVVRLSIMIVALALVLGGVFGFDLFRQKMIAAYFAGNVLPPVPVSAVPVASESISDYLDGIGSVVAVHQVSVAPEVGGRVTKILFESGAEVKEGDPLVQLNDEP